MSLHWPLHSQGRVKDKRLERTRVGKLDSGNYCLLSELARSFLANLENAKFGVLMNSKYFTWNMWGLIIFRSSNPQSDSISAVMVCGYSAVIGSRISTFHGQEVQNQGTFRNVSWFLTPLQRHGGQANPNLFLSFWAQPWTRMWPGVKSVFNGESCSVWEQPTRIIQQLKHHSRNLTSPIALDLSGSWTTKM